MVNDINNKHRLTDTVNSPKRRDFTMKSMKVMKEKGQKKGWNPSGRFIHSVNEIMPGENM